MDAKEAIEIVKENILQIKELQNMFTGKMNTECQRDIDGFLKNGVNNNGKNNY